MRTITRADISDKIYKDLGTSMAESADIVDAIIDELVNCLASGKDMKISSFGTFGIRKKKPRIGRNPRTKEEIPITARSVISFHPSSILVENINK